MLTVEPVKHFASHDLVVRVKVDKLLSKKRTSFLLLTQEHLFKQNFPMGSLFCTTFHLTFRPLNQLGSIGLKVSTASSASLLAIVQPK